MSRNARNVKAIPEGYGTVTAYLVVPDAARAIDLYTRAFGAVELFRMPTPDGKGVAHAEIKIGSSIVMLADENPHNGTKSPASLGGSAVALHLYVEDVDASFRRAVKAGLTEVLPPTDMFWGDRYGRLTDPFGHGWSVATHTEDLTPEQIGERAEQFFAAAAAGAK